MSALRKQDTNYAIVKHWHESHQHMETPPDFSISLVRSHKSSLERQIHEAVSIELADPQVILMNGKSEWGQNRVPRVVNKLEEDANKSPTNCNRKRPPDEQEPVATKTATPDPESFQGQYKKRKEQE